MAVSSKFMGWHYSYTPTPIPKSKNLNIELEAASGAIDTGRIYRKISLQRIFSVWPKTLFSFTNHIVTMIFPNEDFSKIIVLRDFQKVSLGKANF